MAVVDDNGWNKCYWGPTTVAECVDMSNDYENWKEQEKLEERCICKARDPKDKNLCEKKKPLTITECMMNLNREWNDVLCEWMPNGDDNGSI